MDTPDRPRPLRQNRLSRLSVVMPCLNAAATLPTQLDALASQSWEGDWEVIVADNGSTDRSREIVESYQGRIPNLRLVDASDRRGQAHARNVGAAVASGDALLFCDADDQVAPGWLAALGRSLAQHEFVACRYDNEALNPVWVRRTHLNPQKDGLTSYDYPAFLPHAGGGGLGVLKRVHEEVGGFDESMPALEDTDYCWRIQLAGHPLRFAPEAVVNIRHRHGLSSIFRQGMSYGRHNVLIYKKYLPQGMPRLGWTPGALRWAKLLLKTPLMLATREGRARWLWQLGWRVGRIQGCFRYRVVAP
jgi:glycosyltransferase involved in cell wall biosynthesis